MKKKFVGILLVLAASAGLMFAEWIPCFYCNGSRKRQCSSCGGRGDKVCTKCYGNGTELKQNPNFEFGKDNNVMIQVTCSRCGGSLRVPCYDCNG